MSKTTIEILNSGPLMKVLSIVPNKNMFYGHPYGSSMDYKSAQVANQILGKKDTALLVECTLKACQLKFHEAMQFCITGADMNWKLNGLKIENYKVIHAIKGDILSGSFATKGLRSYIGFSKDIVAFDKNQLACNEVDLNLNEINDHVSQLEVKDVIGIKKGPEWELLDANSQTSLEYYELTITKDMSRMGVYLNGNPLHLVKPFPIKSVCTFPGVVQLLPSGQLLVLNQDAQTTGGYPRVAYLDKESLCDFNQMPMGHQLKWRLIN